MENERLKCAGERTWFMRGGIGGWDAVEHCASEEIVEISGADFLMAEAPEKFSGLRATK